MPHATIFEQKVSFKQRKKNTSSWKYVAKVKILTTFAAHGANNERRQE
jgi:hypothetical protein